MQRCSVCHPVGVPLCASRGPGRVASRGALGKTKRQPGASVSTTREHLKVREH